MNARDSAHFPRITSRPGVGATGDVLQQQALVVKRLFMENPTLIYVEHGAKAVRWAGAEYVIHAGEAIAIAGGQSMDVINSPGPHSGYRARWLVWDERMLAEHADAHPELAVIRRAQPMTGETAAFHAALARAVAAVEDAAIPERIARHHMQEMLLWLGLHGCRFEQVKALTWTVKVRRLISQDLAHEWQAAAVAATFAMSEASLRRKLAEEGVSLSQILIDVRMSCALQLLQSTTQSVLQIALAVGYQTASQFALRFRERFGFAPTAIRGHRRASVAAA